MTGWLQGLLDMIYPRTCLSCNRVLQAEEQDVCLLCEANLPVFPFHFFDGNPIEQLFDYDSSISGANAFLSFTEGGIAQKLVHQLKYKGRFDLGMLLGRKAAHHSLRQDPGFIPDMIIPVPLHPEKQKQRGYNQSFAIARGMAEVWDIPVVDHFVLRKNQGATQTHKNRFRRFADTEGVFTLKSGHPFKNKHLLLVDDVVTTGATLFSMSRELAKSDPTSLSLYPLSYKV